MSNNAWDDGANFALSAAGGWDLVAPSSVKMFLTLAGSGRTGRGPICSFAKRAGLSRRTAIVALMELSALGWLEYEGTTGRGIVWQLKNPPRKLAPEAMAYYKGRIDVRRWRLDATRLRLEYREQLERRADLMDRLKSLEERLGMGPRSGAALDRQTDGEIETELKLIAAEAIEDGAKTTLSFKQKRSRVQ